MRAILSQAAGGPETLKLADVTVPVPGPRQVRVRVHAAALNYPDGLMIEDRYQVIQPRPFIPGAELAGVIDAVGAEVRGLAVGDRVIAMPGLGGLAELAAVDAAKCFRIPATMPFATAAALLITYGTAYYALVDHAGLRCGETLLVLGSGSGVGLAAVELGKAMGARVVAAVSSPEKAQIAHRAGADEVLVYPRGSFDKANTRALTDLFRKRVGLEGANVIFDPLGGGYTDPALRALAWRGRYLVIGFTAGIPTVRTNRLLLKGASMSGVYWGSWIERETAGFRTQVAALLTMWEEGRINPLVSQTLPLAHVAEGFRALSERRAIGKIVIALQNGDG